MAEEPDAVYVTYVNQPRPPRADGVIEGRALIDFGPMAIRGMLERPLGDRPMIDATRGKQARRLRKAPWVLDHRRQDYPSDA